MDSKSRCYAIQATSLSEQLKLISDFMVFLNKMDLFIISTVAALSIVTNKTTRTATVIPLLSWFLMMKSGFGNDFPKQVKFSGIVDTHRIKISDF